jgi:hypothetical protein
MHDSVAVQKDRRTFRRESGTTAIRAGASGGVQFPPLVVKRYNVERGLSRNLARLMGAVVLIFLTMVI